jgi:septal ring factor EnvC (AmiA/AmiB activator)
MVRHRKPSKKSNKRHFSRAVTNSSSWVGKDRGPQTFLQRSLRVSSELYIRNKELREEKKDLKEFGVLEMAEKVEDKTYLQRRQQQINELQQQLLEEQNARKTMEKDLQKAQQNLREARQIAWDVAVSRNELIQKCDRLEVEVARARRAEESMRIFVEDSVTTFNEINS